VSFYVKIIRHTSTYAVATVARRLASVIMLPVYTRYFSPADYGVLELLDLTGTIIFYLIGSRLCDGLLYFYAHAQTEHEKTRITHSALLSAHICGILGSVGGCLAARHFTTLLFGTDQYTYYMQLVFLNFAFTLPAEVGFGHLRAENRSGITSTLSIIRLGLVIVTTIPLLVWFHMGIASVLYGGLFSSLVTCVYMDIAILRGKIHFDWNIAKQIGSYSLPIAISSIGITIIHSGDRFFLMRSSTMAAVGLYSLAYKFGQLVGYIQVPFETYWDAQVFHVIRGGDGERHFTRALTYYALALFGGALFLSLAAAPVLRIATKPDFYEAAVLVPVVAFAYAIRGPGDYFRSVFAICKQPFRNVIVTAAGVVITVTAYATLIPRYHSWGAAVATAITFLEMGTVSYLQSRRARIFHFEWRRLAQIVVSSVGIATAALLYRPETIGGQVAISVVGTVAFPAILYITGFFEPAELATIRQYAGAVVQPAWLWMGRLAGQSRSGQ
jgi:O-antigen/teichoic acid export membrane protein